MVLVLPFKHVILFIASKMQIEVAEPYMLQLHRVHRQQQWKICQINDEFKSKTYSDMFIY